ncbi:MAG: sigma-70 family RNA polymerase sigma factor [Pirellulaceae bacterium]|nr:sigma-70 family RNA polymerase sigma factor [Pirellulaceae bacterium]MDP7014869.1 sigma-70 family RNA polymerase sigma factor [Pirellulaceae bacterium]
MNELPETRPSLLKRIQTPREESAWDEFVEIYQPVVYRLARRHGLQDADAWDLAQNVLVAVSNAIDRWRSNGEPGSFRGWLYRITRNLMINYLKQQDRQPRSVSDIQLAELLEEAAVDTDAQGAELDREFDREYERQLFRWAAEDIRGEFRESTWLAFWRTCVEEQDIRTTAAELKLSVGSVYVARSRVMARFKQIVREKQKWER